MFLKKCSESLLLAKNIKHCFSKVVVSDIYTKLKSNPKTVDAGSFTQMVYYPNIKNKFIIDKDYLILRKTNLFKQLINVENEEKEYITIYKCQMNFKIKMARYILFTIAVSIITITALVKSNRSIYLNIFYYFVSVMFLVVVLKSKILNLRKRIAKIEMAKHFDDKNNNVKLILGNGTVKNINNQDLYLPNIQNKFFLDFYLKNKEYNLFLYDAEVPDINLFTAVINGYKIKI